MQAIQALSNNLKPAIKVEADKDFKVQQIRYQGETVEKIVFASLLVGDGYLWLLDNRTPNLIFSATFTFDLQNLAIVSYKKELLVELRPG